MCVCVCVCVILPLSGPLWPDVVVSVVVPTMRQKELYNNLLYLKTFNSGKQTYKC